MSKKRHNPDNVNSTFIPKGCRLLNPEEVGDDKEYKCAFWLPREKRWTALFKQKPHYKIWSYIIKK
jgi:hypothetical protein